MLNFFSSQATTALLILKTTVGLTDNIWVWFPHWMSHHVPGLGFSFCSGGLQCPLEMAQNTILCAPFAPPSPKFSGVSSLPPCQADSNVHIRTEVGKKKH
uniref:Uncharacterized protein n=1 Tax=Eutreptiella gymnastica TaxID=73025 RepID=A0A7S1N8E4_9EUGL